MTDEESRKAFIETVLDHFPTVRLEQNGVDESFLDGYTPTYFEFWQAAVEWATKRERERCGKIIDAFSDGYLLDAAEVINGSLKKIFEEPKPE